jgi:ferredoxin
MGMPVMVKDFIDKIHIPNATYIFSVVTRGYSKGLTFTEINKILMKQGKNLNYGKYISFPDCYIRWIQAHDEESQVKVFNKATKQLEMIRQELLDEKTCVEKEGTILNITSSVINKIWKARLSSINKTFRVSEDCIQCGICVRTCPAKNIKLEGNMLKWDKKCQDCMACVQSCPKKAIYFNARTKNRRRYRNPNISKTELFYWRQI